MLNRQRLEGNVHPWSHKGVNIDSRNQNICLKTRYLPNLIEAVNEGKLTFVA